MNLDVRRVGKVAILDLQGRIVIGDPCLSLRQGLRAVLNDGFVHILINMKDITYIDSTGIGELVSCYTTVTSQGGCLKLLHATARIKDLLQMTKLLTVFEAHSDEGEAVRSFAADC